MLLIQALLIGFLLARLLPRRLSAYTLPLSLAALIPFDGVSLAMATRGLWGDPSFTTVQLLLLNLFGQRPLASLPRASYAGLALAGIGFYVLALGQGNFDPYQLGFQPFGLALPLALAAFALFMRGQRVWLWLLTLDLLAYLMGYAGQTNLWDTLFDPLLILACLTSLLRPSRPHNALQRN